MDQLKADLAKEVEVLNKVDQLILVKTINRIKKELGVI